MKLGFLNILTIIFVIGKVFGAINWSWWLVFAPTILSLSVWMLLWILFFVGFFLKEL